MLNIKNIDKIKGEVIDTNTAQWRIHAIKEDSTSYLITIAFHEGKIDGMVYPNIIYFALEKRKHKDGYYQMASSDVNILKWGLFLAHMDTADNFLLVLKRQLEQVC